MMAQEQCPFPGCEEMLTYEVVGHGMTRDGLTVKLQTVPESTRHAYSHGE